jgi:prepilin-type N-terminal cleavage/methylation domain-containing protein
MPYKVSNKKSAFTLVELAIVIVVLGILVGGVLTGQSIIDSAKRSATVSHITQMKTALNAFKLEFDDIPGDMRDAYDYFGDECGDNSQDDYTGCNGNGDKCVGNQVGYCEPRNNQYWGDFRRFAIHLNLSNIYPDIAMDTDSTDGDCLNITFV